MASKHYYWFQAYELVCLRMLDLERRRPQHACGIAVDADRLAKDWQKLYVKKVLLSSKLKKALVEI
jgi:hypothetical protein